MTAKQWLERGRNLNNEIETLLTAQQRALELACKTSSGSTDDKVQTSRRNTSEDRFISYADYERLINDKIDKLYQVQREITEVIYRVDNSTLRTVLVERYINFNTWEQIAEILKIEVCSVRGYIHRKGMKEIFYILRNESKRVDIERYM